ncbi:MAG TPA: 5'/3'-nucleotidase SurE, partial [Chloroflexia bacterium]|nr:5'/3'-nucleotidase SurE [Chloroflexia bacterium]
MRILLTNDDGIDSEGLTALYQALRSEHEVAVIAPDRNWSIAGHNKTMDRPLRVTERAWEDTKVWATDGTPSDCVALAALGFLGYAPDLVVSGINKGPNLGDDITYSGTVAAAMEAVISELPAVAVSIEDYLDWHFETAATFIARLVRKVALNGIPSGVLLNVNVPNVAESEITGVVVTRLGRRIYRDELVRRLDPRGRPYYWIGGDIPQSHLEEGTDAHAVANNQISVTPIHLDLTNHRLLEVIAGWQLA